VPPTVDEVHVLLRAAEATNPEMASLIFVAVTTGCRRGELCGLRWSDVDLALSTIVVRRSISDADGKISVKGTKTHQARRLALDPATVEVLRRHLSFVEVRAIAAETALSQNAYVWSQMLDGSAPYRPDRVTETFRNLTERIGSVIPQTTGSESPASSRSRAARGTTTRRPSRTVGSRPWAGSL
jgi:integrase